MVSPFVKQFFSTSKGEPSDINLLCSSLFSYNTIEIKRYHQWHFTNIVPIISVRRNEVIEIGRVGGAFRDAFNRSKSA